MIKDSDVAYNLKFILKVKSEKNAEDIFKIIIESYDSNAPIITLIILNKESGDTIGLCGLLPSKDENGTECFFTVLPNYRGHGFAIEAMKKLIEYAFKELNFIRIILFIAPKNSQGWKVAERVGMKYLGHVSIKDISSKMMHFSIERSEFEAQGDY